MNTKMVTMFPGIAKVQRTEYMTWVVLVIPLAAMACDEVEDVSAVLILFSEEFMVPLALGFTFKLVFLCWFWIARCQN